MNIGINPIYSIFAGEYIELTETVTVALTTEDLPAEYYTTWSTAVPLHTDIWHSTPEGAGEVQTDKHTEKHSDNITSHAKPSTPSQLPKSHTEKPVTVSKTTKSPPSNSDLHSRPEKAKNVVHTQSVHSDNAKNVVHTEPLHSDNAKKVVQQKVVQQKSSHHIYDTSALEQFIKGDTYQPPEVDKKPSSNRSHPHGTPSKAKDINYNADLYENADNDDLYDYTAELDGDYTSSIQTDGSTKSKWKSELCAA